MNEHIMDIVVQEEDIDELNHVNNKVYIDFLETARIAWHEHIGLDLQKMIEQGYGDVLRNINVSYIKEAVLGEKLQVKTVPQSVGNSSFVMKQWIYNENDEVITEAEAVIVLVDLHKREKVSIPEETSNIIQQYITK